MPRILLLAPLLGLLVAGTAPARDLPQRKAEPRATGCEAYGPGYTKVEGSDTCIKISGSVRVEYSRVR